jgi:hypothetical protein
MQIVAEKRMIELSENNIETTKTVFVVEPGETVEALLLRVGMDGRSRWHYDQAEVRLKLVKLNDQVQSHLPSLVVNPVP